MTHMIAEHIRGVIFDLDGTLIDSMLMWKEIDIEYLKRHNRSMPENLQKCIQGMSGEETAVYFKTNFGIPDSVEQIIADWNAMARDAYENRIGLKNGCLETLKELKARGLKLGIATSNFRELVEVLLKKHGIYSLFDAVVTTDDVKVGKPAPDVYLRAAEELGLEPGLCVGVEDLPEGLQAVKRAGMLAVAVEDAYSAAMREEKCAIADVFIEELKELL